MEKEKKIKLNFVRRDSQVFRVVTPDRSSAEQVSETREAQSREGKEKLVTVVTCPHGKVLHHLDEVAGFCAVPGCNAPLCADCTKENICSICTRIFCINHARDTFSGKKACALHSFAARLFL